MGRAGLDSGASRGHAGLLEGARFGTSDVPGDSVQKLKPPLLKKAFSFISHPQWLPEQPHCVPGSRHGKALVSVLVELTGVSSPCPWTSCPEQRLGMISDGLPSSPTGSRPRCPLGLRGQNPGKWSFQRQEEIFPGVVPTIYLGALLSLMSRWERDAVEKAHSSSAICRGI